MLSGIQHFAFCRRQWALIHLEQAWKENVLTLEGKFMHEKAHASTTEKRGDMIVSRGMPVFSRELGISGICDVVELWWDDSGVPIHGRKGTYRVVPAEYKRGRPKEHDADKLQLCAQAMCLEEMLLCNIPEGRLFYGETKRRCDIPLTYTLRQTVQDMLREMHEYQRRGYTPKVKAKKACNACSLIDMCIPKLMKSKSVFEYIHIKTGEADE